MMPVLLPVYTLMSISIPMLDPASYSKPWLITSMAFSPMVVACYANLYDQPVAMGAATALGAVLAALAGLLTRGRAIYEVPTLTFGGRSVPEEGGRGDRGK